MVCRATRTGGGMVAAVPSTSEVLRETDGGGEASAGVAPPQVSPSPASETIGLL